MNTPATAAPPRRRLRGFDAGIIALLAALFVFVELGFFRPDPRMAGTLRVLIRAARVVAPALGLFVIAVYAGMRTRRLRASAVVLMLFGTVLALLLAYPVAVRVYARSFDKKIAEFHPYFQLAPPEFRLRPEAAGTRPFRIVCLGGSTTEFRDGGGRGWPERLRDLLVASAAPGRPIEVYNQGRQWYTTQHMLLHYAANIRPHRPDLVVAMEAINDLLQNADFCYFSYGPFREDYGHFYGPAYRLIRRPSLEATAAYVFRSMWYFPGREVVDTDVFPGLAPFERNLRSLVDLVRADGGRVVLMTQPYLIKENMTPAEDAALHMLRYEAVGPRRQWSAATARRGMERYDETVRRLAAELGLPLVDLERAVPKTLEYLWDDVHYTDAGFDLVARTVAARLAELEPD